MVTVSGAGAADTEGRVEVREAGRDEVVKEEAADVVGKTADVEGRRNEAGLE